MSRGESFVYARGLYKSYGGKRFPGARHRHTAETGTGDGTRPPARGDSVAALRGVDIDIEENTILGLVGESGAGKTTLARALLYLEPPDAGEVRVGGIDPAAPDRASRRRFRGFAQIVFQDPHSALNPRLTVAQTIGEALAARGVLRKERRERTAELLDLTGISPGMMERRPPDFSGGQKQRIVIARALATEPRFLVLDEPVSSLDVSIQAQIINLLMDLKSRLGLTYLFVSHDLNLVSYISDTVAVMHDGVIVETADARAIVTSPQSEESRRLYERAPVFRDMRVRAEGGN
jgi:ABC-type glutathione transport system ATPase component